MELLKSPLSITTTTKLAQALAELDRMLHNSQALLSASLSRQEKSKPGVPKSWQAVRGLWKGIFRGDPVKYQRQLRAEE